MPAARAAEPPRPAQLLQRVPAHLLVRELLLELEQGLRELHTFVHLRKAVESRDRRLHPGTDLAVLALVDSPEVDLLVIDSPPGTSCPVIESVRGADFVLLVTEPTPFGLSDLKLAVEMVRALGIPFGVVINRADVGDGESNHYCRTQRIDILAEIPDDREVAEAYSRGQLACEALPQYQRLFSELLEKVESAVTAAAEGGRSAR